jgi:hypothetical protein
VVRDVSVIVVIYVSLVARLSMRHRQNHAASKSHGPDTERSYHIVGVHSLPGGIGSTLEALKLKRQNLKKCRS